ncbi:hypothetical protein [Candidatus Pantoea carbekii]|nr:hypothetical protein [Candidatus Pantoea carbekii]
MDEFSQYLEVNDNSNCLGVRLVGAKLQWAHNSGVARHCII